jgi:hypothetical protein
MFWFILSLVLIYVLVFILSRTKEQANREHILSLFKRYVREVQIWNKIGKKDPVAKGVAKGYLLALKDYMRAYNIYPDNVKVVIGVNLRDLEKSVLLQNKVTV